MDLEYEEEIAQFLRIYGVQDVKKVDISKFREIRGRQYSAFADLIPELFQATGYAQYSEPLKKDLAKIGMLFQNE